jgi:hypothetical protein
MKMVLNSAQQSRNMQVALLNFIKSFAESKSQYNVKKDFASEFGNFKNAVCMKHSTGVRTRYSTIDVTHYVVQKTAKSNIISQTNWSTSSTSAAFYFLHRTKHDT